MFKIGDLVVYGNIGVCTVENVGPSNLSGADKNKDYYSLQPYYSGNSKILTPCDNEKVVIRAILTLDEVNLLINDIPNIETITINDEKQREQTYKNLIRGCNCREMMSLLKTINERKQKRLAEGKKITSSDEKYFNMAEDKLHGEFAVVLGLSREQVKEYIIEKIEAVV